MSDHTTPKRNDDPAERAPAEGQSHPIPPQGRGRNPGVDPAAKDAPAEGGREEVEQQAERAANDPRGT